MDAENWTQPADWLPSWTNKIELPDSYYQQVLKLLQEWNSEQEIIKKYKNDYFIIYGHVRRQDDIKDEVISIYQKHRIA